MAYSDDLQVNSIFVEPPEASILTDEESGDEEEYDINHLSGKQLAANAEVILENHERISVSQELDSRPRLQENIVETDPFEITNDIPAYTRCQKFEWIKGDLVGKNNHFPVPNYNIYAEKSIVEMFELFFDNEIVEYLVQQSKLYSQFKNYADPNISADELKCAIAILIVSGYNKTPGKRYFWDSGYDMKNTSVSESMRRNRFFTIMQFLHCADNNNPNFEDKAWKLRPLMDKIKERFLTNFVPEEHISYDETMIKYYGHHGCKQFIRGKPIRFGFKMWSLNTSSGYLINFNLYQGKDPNENQQASQIFGKPTEPFIRMLNEMPDDKKRLPYKFYFDNLFTSANLLLYLRENGYGATGTVRENRVPKSCPLPNKQTLGKEMKRGDYCSMLDRENGIFIIKWMDNNLVILASTSYGVFPTSLVRRFSRKEKKVLQVPQPHLIAMYNKHMGGTDVMDENVSRYRISIRSKKWWWCLFTWLLDVAIENAWTLHKKAGHKMTQLQFRREIAQVYLARYGTAAKGPGRPSTSKVSVTLNRISDDIRYDHHDHLLTYTEGKKRKRCAGEGCSASVRTMCQKCKVGLCIECNIIFHTK